MRYIILPRAQAEMRQIWSFSFSHWGKAQADRYLGSIEARFAAIAENPKMGRPYGKRRSGHFKALVGSHAVIYQVSSEEIVIVRVLHQRMKTPRRL